MHRVIVFVQHTREDSGRLTPKLEIGRLDIGDVDVAAQIGAAMVSAARDDWRRPTGNRMNPEPIFGFVVCKFMRDWQGRSVWVDVQE